VEVSKDKKGRREGSIRQRKLRDFWWEACWTYWLIQDCRRGENIYLEYIFTENIPLCLSLNKLRTHSV